LSYGTPVLALFWSADLRLKSIGRPTMPELTFEAVDDKLTTSTLEKEGRITATTFFYQSP